MTEPSVCHRTGPLTVRDYDEAITDLLAAKHALQRGESGGCDVCGSDEHWPSQCHQHNPLILAREAAAARAVYRCWHCGFEARTDAEGLEHFGRTEFAEPACRRPYRTMDEGGDPTAAGAVAWDWAQGIARKAFEELDGDDGTVEVTNRPGANVVTVYRGTKLLAASTVFRDEMNFAVLIRWLPAVEGGE